MPLTIRLDGSASTGETLVVAQFILTAENVNEVIREIERLAEESLLAGRE